MESVREFFSVPNADDDPITPLVPAMIWDTSFNKFNARNLMSIVQRIEYGLEVEGFQVVSAFKLGSNPLPFAVLYRLGNNHILAIRGTDPSCFSEILSDLDYFQTDVCDTHVHEGIWKITVKMYEFFAPLLAKVDRLFVCGHSLGGGVANLFQLAREAHDDQRVMQVVVYAFASPRVFAPEYQCKIPTFNLVNLCDPVPSVPLCTMTGGYHFDTVGEIWVFKRWLQGTGVHHLSAYWDGCSDIEKIGVV